MDGNRRDRKKRQTREALLEAALRLVDERGLDQVTVDDISAAADVSPRTFFNYFATKDEALLGDPLEDAATVHERLLAEPADLPLLDAMRRVMAPWIDRIQAERGIWLLRMRVIRDNPALLPALVARGVKEEGDLVTAVAARAGLPREHPFPQVAANVIGGAFRTAMMRWGDADDGRPLLDFVTEAFAVVASGLRQDTQK